MLDASRVAASRLDLCRELFDLGALVKEVARDVGAMAQGRAIVVNAPAEGVLVEADRDRIEQVVFNLLDNAIKYSPAYEPIVVDVWSEAAAAWCRVTDRGIGVPPDVAKHLFTCFGRERSERTRSITGLGVGLYISRGLVEAHGGTIACASEAGKGSAFTFGLPLRAGARASRKFAEAAAAAAPGH
jgi:signal transduction histidine kinase